MINLNPIQKAIKQRTRNVGFLFLIISIVFIFIGLMIIILFGKLDFTGYQNHFHISRLSLLEDVFGAGLYGFLFLCLGISFLIIAIIFFWQSRSTIDDELDQMIYDKMIKEGKKTLENHEDDENSRRYGVIDRLKLHGEDTGGIPQIKGGPGL
jgi:hypothetical protein